MTVEEYIRSREDLAEGVDYYFDNTNKLISLSDRTDRALDEFADDISDYKYESVMIPSHYLIEYAIGSGLTEKEAIYFYRKHPEFIGCEKDPKKLHELGEALEAEKDALSGNNNIESFVEDSNITSNNPDYTGYTEKELDILESRGAAVKIVNKWLCQALDKNAGEMVRNACIVLKAIERKAYTDSLDISVTEDNGVYKVEAKSSYNNYEDSKVCYISKKSDGNLYVKFHDFSGLHGHLEGDSDYWGLNFALGAPSWMITSQEHEWDNVISKIVNKL